MTEEALLRRISPSPPYMPVMGFSFAAEIRSLQFVKHECCDSYWWGPADDTCLFCEQRQD